MAESAKSNPDPVIAVPPSEETSEVARGSPIITVSKHTFNRDDSAVGNGPMLQ